MKNVSVLILTGLALVLNMVNMSGFGSAHQTELYTRYGLLFLALALLLRRPLPGYRIGRVDFLVTAYLFLALVVSSCLAGAVGEAFACLSSFLIVYIFSRFSLDGRTARRVGWLLLAGGCALLVLYLKTELISGWNPNAIAMIGFFSFMGYAASVMYNSTGLRRLAVLALFGGFLHLISQTDARSSTACVCAAALICLFPRQAGRLLASRKVRFFLVSLALLFAVLMAAFSGTALYETMDAWSMETYAKPLLNGRDEIWREGLALWRTHWLLGVGSFAQNAWHNWSISLLAAYGLAGYLLWTHVVQRILNVGEPCWEDPYVKGYTTAFLLILVQQMAELGLIGSQNIHLIPYVLLGLLVGRVRYLQEQKWKEGT